ncbi:MAG: ion channel [Pyrinomonadaceae bacterium]
MRKRKLLISIITISIILWPLLYGSLVFLSDRILSIPDRAYLYVMKPLSLILALIIYIFFILKRTKVIKTLFQLVEISLMSLSLILTVIFSYTDIYRYLGIIDGSGVMVRDSVSCFYFSIVTYTTLGYGDYRPSPEARLFAASEALLGYILLSLFIGVLLQSIYKLQGDSS